MLRRTTVAAAALLAAGALLLSACTGSSSASPSSTGGVADPDASIAVRLVAQPGNLDIRETASFVTAFTAGEFQVSIGGWAADYPDPQNWLPIFTSTAPLNFGHYSNDQYDDLIAEAGAEVDFDRRLELYGQAQQLLIDEVGVMPLSYPLRGALVKPWVQGFVPSPREGTVPGDLYFDQISISGRP